jgi:hypothetical protein
LFLFPSLVQTMASYETSMTTSELKAFREVSRQCQDDVERLCDPVPFFFPPPFMRMTMDTTQQHLMLRGRPMMTMMQPLPPPPPPPPTLLGLGHDLGSFIDQLMMSALAHPMPTFANGEDSNSGGNFLFFMSTADTEDHNSEPCDHHRQVTTRQEQQGEQMDFSASPPHEENRLVHHVLRQFVSPEVAPDDAEYMVHHVLRQFVSPETSPEEAERVLERVSDHAQLWVEHRDASTPQRRMARRLSEVSVDDIRRANDQAYYAATTTNAAHEVETSFLPFNPALNRCLRLAFQHNVLHTTCQSAMARLENVRASQHMMPVYKKEAEQTMLSHLALLYFLVIATAIVIFVRHSSKDFRATRRLRTQVLQAIYSKPHLKRAVEAELGGGVSIGSVPPLQWPDLMHLGRHGHSFGRWLRVARLVRIAMLTIMCVLLLVAPAVVLPFCIILAAGLFWSALCAPSPVRSCCCCSCGLSAQDAQAGLVTSEQTCCDCCSGTGCCSVHCCCCGKSNDKKQQDGDVGCCKNDCCCTRDGCCDNINNKDCRTLETGYVKMEDNFDNGCCCCCGESYCCGGTDCGCCSCCMDTCSCDPDKCCSTTHESKSPRPVMAAKCSVVYEGIPLQIV